MIETMYTVTKTVKYIRDDNVGYVMLIIITILIVLLFITAFLSNKASKNELSLFKTAIAKIDSNKNYNKSKTIMENNLLEIKEYYVMSKKFAYKSFILAVASSFVGIVCIIFAIFVFLVMDTLNYLPILTAALLEFVSATSLFVFKSTQTNLQSYFNALHENEQLLMLIDLADNLSNDDIRDKVYIDIINSKIK